MACLEIKVLYFSINNSHSLGEYPNSLAVRICPGAAVQLNGTGVPDSEEAVLNMRLDQADEEMQSITYVDTNHVSIKGSFQLQIQHQKELLMSARVQEHGSGWGINCEGGTGPWSSMLSMELGIVGNSLGSSVILSETVEIVRKRSRKALLDKIEEEEQEQEQRPQQRKWKGKLRSCLDGGIDLIEAAHFSRIPEAAIATFSAVLKNGVLLLKWQKEPTIHHCIKTLKMLTSAYTSRPFVQFWSRFVF